MNKHIKYLSLILVLLLATADFIYAGGGNRNGTQGASELLIPVGSRGIALGGSNISTTTGIEALFWNPAGVSRSSRSAEAMFSYMSYIADMGVTYGAVSANISDIGTFALSIKSLSFGDIDVTTDQAPDGTGQKYSPQYITTGLTYSRALSDRVSVGVTANLVMETIAQVSATGVAFNAGVMYENLGDINGLSIGLTLKNIGPQMSFSGSGLYQLASVSTLTRPAGYYLIDAASFELPALLEFGAAYRPQINEQNSVLISTSFQNSEFQGDVYRFGVEYMFNNLIALRGGYAYTPESQETNNIFGLTAGVGINYNLGGTDLKVDYAYRQVKHYFDANHVITVGLGF
ncbi:MAG: PorV/PorQ family protein [Bacteroidota bacterium]|nr:PorV/PorQ family protein [Bacteroidota bacterium]MDP4191303.1 PorV/PorQ family protein [Bacteroidota bacterium]